MLIPFIDKKEYPLTESVLRRFSMQNFYLVSLLFALLKMELCTENSDGEHRMNEHFSTQRDATFDAVIFPTESGIDVLFQVPFRNSIGTNSLRNEITILCFDNGTIKYHSWFRDVLKDLGGGMQTPLPIICESSIAISQTRRFTFFNFKTNTFNRYRICPSIDESIEKVMLSNLSRRQFIFEIISFNQSSRSDNDYKKYLKLVDLSTEQPLDPVDPYLQYDKRVQFVQELEIAKRCTWTFAQNTLFLFEGSQIKTFSDNLRPIDHPILLALNEQITKQDLDVVQISVHPSLPLCILVDIEKAPRLIFWDDRSGDRQLVPLLDNYSCNFSFSCDGKWVAFNQLESSGKSSVFIIPVSSEYDQFLGIPIFLGDYEPTENGIVWIDNPQALVLTQGDGHIIKWELTNEAHPESDKPTFWDYIVKKDIEKLRAEGKMK